MKMICFMYPGKGDDLKSLLLKPDLKTTPVSAGTSQYTPI